MSRRLSGSWLVVCGLASAIAGACGDESDKGDDGSGNCEQGSERCTCYRDDSCDDNLECLSGLCVDPDHPAGSLRGGAGGEPGSGQAEAGADDITSGGSGAREPSSGGQDDGAAGDSAGRGGSSGTGNTSPTPVALHGALSVSGANLIDSSGKRVKLEGISSMWLNWDPTGYAESKAGLAWMRDNWNLRVIRAAMGVDAEGGYLEDPATAKAQVNRIVQNAIELGVYVIIDWHDHEALAHQSEAAAFFDEMSAQWGSRPNVLYEVFNEPLALDWQTRLKPYHQSLVSVIRENDPDNVIVLGTPNWDQDVDVAAQSPLSGANLMYALHFYACSHQTRERDKAKTARSLGLPLFVTEWGATDADGGVDGLVCEGEARAWHDFLDSASISWTAWKLDGCSDSSCMFKDRTAPLDGGWTANVLNGHAPIVIDEMKSDPSGGGGGTGGSATGGSATGGSATGGKSSGGASSGGSGGTGSIDEDFPPNPDACKLVTSCPTCCETVGVFALDALSEDVTGTTVRGFDVGESSATASFDFKASNEIGAIFFQFAEPQDIGALGLGIGGTGSGLLEVALVQGGGANGCIYPFSGGELSSFPSDCWGNGAGPSVSLPADQLEVRVRSVSSGHAVLTVSEIVYSP